MKWPLIIILFSAIGIAGCSKKHQPQGEPVGKTTDLNTNNAAKTTVAKKARSKTPLAKVITVDDRAARSTPDGRLYYDLNGKRYWKNYDDGKYYLFNKKMYTDPAFKPH